MTIMRTALRVGLALAVALAGAAAARLHAPLSAANADRAEDLWPDPRERQGFRLESLRNAVRSYAAGHHDTLPPDLRTLVRWIPSEERASVAGWVVDLWGTPVLYAPLDPLVSVHVIPRPHTELEAILPQGPAGDTGASFTLRSAGADRAWRTADDVILSGSETARGSAGTPRTRGHAASPARRPPNVVR